MLKTETIHTKTKNQRRINGFFALTHRMHTIAGVFVAPLILVAALSGLLYAFAPSLETIVYRDALNATSNNSAQPLTEQVKSAQTQHPNLEVSAVQIPEKPGQTTRVLFSDPDLPNKSYHHTVFVDPGDLSIKGDMVQYGSSNALPLRTWISRGHKDLWLGKPGQIYSETAASWMGILALGGIWLWWSRRNNKRSTSARAVALRRHTLLGIIIVPGLLFLTITGLTWSQFAGENIATVRQQLNWTTPKPDATLPGTAPNSTNPLDQVDAVVSAAKAGGLTGDIEATVPTGTDQGWVVKESRVPWKMENDAVVIDGSNAEIIRELPFSKWPFAAKLTSWLIQLHMGLLFGIVSQIALGLLALGIITMIVLGYYMWWTRGRGKKPGRLPAPAARKASRIELGVFVALLIAYSILAPLFGVSLIAFLLGEAAWRFIRNRQHQSGLQHTPQ